MYSYALEHLHTTCQDGAVFVSTCAIAKAFERAFPPERMSRFYELQSLTPALKIHVFLAHVRRRGVQVPITHVFALLDHDTRTSSLRFREREAGLGIHLRTWVGS